MASPKKQTLRHTVYRIGRRLGFHGVRICNVLDLFKCTAEDSTACIKPAVEGCDFIVILGQTGIPLACAPTYKNKMYFSRQMRTDAGNGPNHIKIIIN